MKRIMSKEEFLTVYERQQSSGLIIRYFCEKEAYSASCFHYWKKKFDLSRTYMNYPEKVSEDTFIPLYFSHSGKHPSAPNTDVIIELPSGIKIHLDSRGNAELLLGLIHKLYVHVLSE